MYRRVSLHFFMSRVDHSTEVREIANLQPPLHCPIDTGQIVN